MVNVLKRIFTNNRRIFYSSHFFQHAQTIPTNKTNWNESKRSQTHTYELHNDGRRTHTNWNEIQSDSTRKYMQVDVGGCSSICEGALKYTSTVPAMKGRKWYSLKKDVRPFVTGTSIMTSYNKQLLLCCCCWCCSYTLSNMLQPLTNITVQLLQIHVVRHLVMCL